MGQVIDARFVFDAKRALTHAYLKTGRLTRALPQGGTVERLSSRDQDWPPAQDEIMAWLQEFHI